MYCTYVMSAMNLLPHEGGPRDPLVCSKSECCRGGDNIDDDAVSTFKSTRQTEFSLGLRLVTESQSAQALEYTVLVG